ncbi:uncharacterized protein LOC108880233 [Lates calcarifer]|uniref:Uncharacterized protein LOC108880233 n=1 Tax=Lates calcarifer TaxID=8187 RepID=A0AAJ7PIV9_LATCA|nr:uncharacterized protein LOC108880233 [Lates calcarifer]
MSAVWLKLITILCLSCTAQGDPGNGGVVWSEVGQAITIQCQSSETLQDSLTLTKGLNEEVEAVFVDRTTQNFKIADPFKGRLQLNNRFPTVDIRIKNLTSNDTGPYWCVYKRFDTQSAQIITSKGQGSVLLVVTDAASAALSPRPHNSNEPALLPGDNEGCESPNQNLVLVCVVISAAVLLGIILCILALILVKTKILRTREKPRRVTNNDVYEDMRGTLRR